MAGSAQRANAAPHVCCLSGQRTPDAPCLHCDIRHMSVCGALDPAGLAQLQSQVGHECFEPGQTIVTEGEVADRGFILLSGMVSLSKSLPDGRRQILGFLLPGDFIGIAGDDQRYCHSAEAVIRTELCRFRTETLERLADRHPEFRRRLMGTIASEMCAAQEHMLWVGRKSALERVASFLITLARWSSKRRPTADDAARYRRLSRSDRSLGHPQPRSAREKGAGLGTEGPRGHHSASRAARSGCRGQHGCGRRPQALRPGSMSRAG